MNDRLEKLVERMERGRGRGREGGKALWYIAFTDTLLDLLLVLPAVTHDDLRAELEKRLAANADNALLSGGYEEALRALEQHRPS